MVASEETRLARKRQNRQAQVIYRERKRAAEWAQKHRINHLENVVEQMSSVFMDFADELMGFEDLKRNLHIVDCLRTTIEAMVRLAGEVVESEGDEAWTSENPTEEATSQPAKKVQSSQEKDHPVVNIYPEPIELPQTGLELASSTILFEPLSELPLASNQPFDLLHKGIRSCKMPPSFFGNGWLPNHGAFVDMTPPFNGIYVPPDSFSYRLVERTLDTTYSVLFSDPGIIDNHTKSIFKYTLETKTREGILTHVRWMLGPGRHRVFKAVDIPASRVAELLWRGQAHLVETDGEDFFRTETYADGLAKAPLPPTVLSAMQVQQKLEQLGAREVGNDVLELTLPSKSSSPDSDAENYRGQRMAEATTIRLSISLLIYNLSMTAICLHVGPGFKSDSLYSAVEASVIPAPI